MAEKYDIFKDIEMLEHPLLTEEGFLNEACINELEKAILNIPKTHNRLAGEEEWNRKRITSKRAILASFAKYAVWASPYCCPEGLERVLGYLRECLGKEIQWEKIGDFVYSELSLCDISKVLYDILYEKRITLFDAWNEPKKDWRKEKLEGRPDDPDYDCIDLDALLHNVCLDIRMERRANDEFDRKFEEKCGNIIETE